MPSTPRRTGWHKSSHSDQGNGCVEVRLTDTGAEIRDTKIADSPAITFTRAQWTRWIDEVTAGRLTNDNGAVEVSTTPNAWTVRARDTTTTLTFTDHEWAAFRAGVADGEFSADLVAP
ncbi:DUF397 domain-containing protein [Actinokineospora cianjurensis]|uniref:Uncharacterized protein DUF397 n=1 Tax=Actinokineospora cianjurensis TaxID=585224 RepID=A0A421B1S8_9PSEU|nr:DUF397 domain-containing protein [Actinokineospora cianjurensis]RLK58379.1 uncharacterized protein DUF397 [Actinokineospora cianjurensis]